MTVEVIVIYVIGVVSAGVCIFFSYQLYLTYRIGFLHFYQNFLIFFLTAAFLNSVGMTLGTNLLTSLNIDPRITINIIFLPLIIPLSLISLYFFLRFAGAWLDDSLPSWLSMFFFAFWLAQILIHAYSIYLALKTKNPSLNELSTWLWDISFIIIQYLVLLYMVWRSRSLKDEKKGSGIRTFSLIYFFGLLVLDIISSRQLAAWIGYPRSLMLFLLNFLVHLPPLFFLIRFMKSFFREPEFQSRESPVLLDFFREKNISGREREIIWLLLEGKSNREIEKELFISIGTVKNHIYSIFQKSDVNNRLQLIGLMHKLKDAK